MQSTGQMATHASQPVQLSAWITAKAPGTRLRARFDVIGEEVAIEFVEDHVALITAEHDGDIGVLNAAFKQCLS